VLHANAEATRAEPNNFVGLVALDGIDRIAAQLGCFLKLDDFFKLKRLRQGGGCFLDGAGIAFLPH